jgi:hypothetical protein
VYPDISAELPGVLLKEQEQDFQPLTDDPEPDFRDLAGDALYNAGIDTDEALRRAQLGDTPPGPAMVEANEDELVYELTFDLPDAGLGPTQGNQTMILGEDRNDNTPITIAEDTDSPSDGRRSPTQACRSAAGNQPYDAPLNLPAREPVAHRTRARAPHTTHRSVLEANKLARMTKEERLLATTTTTSGPFVDDVTHRVDRVMFTTSEEELGVMAYILMQYNLKPGLSKFGTRGEKAALKEMTQLHIMDTWTPGMVHA